MKIHKISFKRSIVVACMTLLFPLNLNAHCDRLDGPVVQAARNALAQGDLNPVLIWVDERHQEEVQAAFEHVRSVRKLGKEAQAMADRYFFETVVRVHRAGEGEPYTGLKSAEDKLPRAIVAADKAVVSGEITPVLQVLNEEATGTVKERFQALQAKKNFDPKDLAAGRAYVAAYVTYIHTVEGIHQAATGQLHHGKNLPASAEHPGHASATKGHEHGEH